MAQQTVTRSYAETLVDLATRAGGDLDEWGEMLGDVADSIRNDLRLQVFLGSPRVPTAKKTEIVGQAFQDRLPRLLVRFLQSVITHWRQHLIPEISVEYNTMVDRLAHCVHAEVAVARAPDESTRRVIQAQLDRMLGMAVVPHFTVRPEILGGTIVLVGDTVMDGSVRRRLRALRRRMLGTNVG